MLRCLSEPYHTLRKSSKNLKTIYVHGIDTGREVENLGMRVVSLYKLDKNSPIISGGGCLLKKGCGDLACNISPDVNYIEQVLKKTLK